MNLEDLRAVQEDERRSDSLQSLPDSFYRDVAEYVAGLREERERAAAEADDPFSSEEVRRLTDEIETAEEVVEAIYERRVGKVVKRASLAAAGMAADDEGLTTEETMLFERLVERIEANRREVLDVIGGADATADDAVMPTTDESTAADDPSPADAPPPDAEAAPDAAFDATDAMGGDAADESPRDGRTDSAAAPDADPTPDGGAAPAEAAGEPPADADRVTVRITQDVGEIYGVDERVYDLAAEDVVTLPADNAEPLVERGAAQRLE